MTKTKEKKINPEDFNYEQHGPPQVRTVSKSNRNIIGTETKLSICVPITHMTTQLISLVQTHQ